MFLSRKSRTQLVAHQHALDVASQPNHCVAAGRCRLRLGFIFAHDVSSDVLESSLRLAHQRLAFEIQADIPVSQANSTT